jgi:serine/threonine-protein kinase
VRNLTLLTLGVAAAAAVIAAPRTASGQSSRLLIGDFESDPDARLLGSALSITTAAALSRSEAVIVVPRQEVYSELRKSAGSAPIDMVLVRTRALTVCERVHCAQILLGELNRDVATIHVHLRLLLADGTLTQSTELNIPLREIPLMPQTIAAEAGKLLSIKPPMPPIASELTLRALGAAWLLAERGEVENAALELGHARQPDDTLLRFASSAGDLDALLGTSEGLPRLRARLALEPAKALPMAEKFGADNPTDGAAKLVIARALIDVGRAQDALHLLEGKPSEANSAQTYLLRGKALIKLNQAVKAQNEIEHAIELNAKMPEAHLLLGQLVTTRNPTQAATELRTAAEQLRDQKDPRYAGALTRAFDLTSDPSLIGKIDDGALAPANYEGIRKRLEVMAKQQPANAQIVSALGQAEISAGDLTQGRVDLEKIGVKSPLDVTSNRKLARALAELGEHRLAMAVLRTQLQQDHSGRTALDAGREAVRADDPAAARQFLAQAQSGPLAAQANRELGELELAHNNAKGAAPLLQKAIEGGVNDARTRLELAQAMTAAGDGAGAQTQLKSALELDPELGPEAAKLKAAAATAEAAPKPHPSENQVAAGMDSNAPADVALDMPLVPPDALDAIAHFMATFPPFAEPAPPATRTQAAPLVVIASQSGDNIMTRILPTRHTEMRVIDDCLTALVNGQLRMRRTAMPPGISNPPAQLVQMADVAKADYSAVVVARTMGFQVQLEARVYDARSGKSWVNIAQLAIPGAQSQINWMPVAAVVLLLISYIGWLRVRPRGKLLARVTYDPKLGASLFSIRIYKIRRSGMSIQGGEEKFVEAVRKKGTKISSRGASMVGKETVFTLPAGKWWIYLYGVTLEGERPIGNFMFEKQVDVPANREGVVDFNLIPENTTVRVVVNDGQAFLPGAEVWFDGEAHHVVYTNKMAGGVMTVLPRGDHTVHIRAQGKTAERTVSVQGHRPIEVVFDLQNLDATPAVIEPTPPPSLKEIAVSARVSKRSVPQVARSKPGDVTPPPAALSATNPAPVMERYETRGELGRGAMGVVYEAWDRVLEREVALKVISEELRQRPEMIELFMREAKSLAALNHPNIVTVFDFGQSGVEYFMALELVHGRTLEAELIEKGGKLPIARAVQVTLDVSAGLAYAHERRIIHRDIKPANLFILKDGRVKIMDFGLARIVRSVAITKTQVSGTPLYMSPEQIRGSEIDFRADLYSLGCVFYELCTGRPPFVDGEILYHHVNTTPPPPRTLVPDLPAALETVIMRTLEKDKAQRYDSVQEFAQALEQVRAPTPSLSGLSLEPPAPGVRPER